MRLGRGKNWERPQNPTKESLCLEEGKTYIFLMPESEETSPKKKTCEKEDEVNQMLQAPCSI